jgi:hypothetical protein
MTRRVDQWERRPPTEVGAPAVELRREGRLSRLQVGERTVIVPHTIGLQYLTRLLEHAGEEIPAVELAGCSDGNPERSRVSVHKAIKRALRLLTEADPTLGQAITSRVVTGTHCVYLVSPTWQDGPSAVRCP